MFRKKATYFGWTLLFLALVGHITGDYSNRDVEEGKTLDVFCQGAISPGGQVFWQNSKQTFHQDGQSLKIADITRNFTGEYVCFDQDPSTGSTKQIFSIFVNVIYPAKILSIDIANDTVKDNEVFSMTMEAEGNPLPNIEFVQLSTGKVVYSETKDSAITISFTVHCDDMGVYALTCANMLNYDNMRVNITVLCIAVPDPSFPLNTTISPRIGESALLSAHVRAYPAPTFQWLQGGAELTTHNDTELTSALTVYPVTVQNFNTITLSMSNAAGTSTITYYVVPKGPPEPVTNVQVSAVTQYSANLTWLSGYDYNKTQTFVVMNSINENVTELQSFVDEPNDKGGMAVTRTVSGLAPLKAYNISILSRNEDGTCEQSSKPTSFLTLGSPIPDPTKYIEYTYKPRLGDNVTLQMFSIGKPPPTFSWQHNEQPVEHVDCEQCTKVHLVGITPDRFGIYTCSMTNSEGTSVSNFTVQADGPPEAASDLDVGTVTTGTAQLSWTPGYDYGSIQTFTVVQLQDNKYQDMDTFPAADHSTDRVTHDLTQLASDTTYIVQIRSGNDKGYAANFSNALQFTTDALPKTTPAPSGCYRATLSLSLACSWIIFWHFVAKRIH